MRPRFVAVWVVVLGAIVVLPVVATALRGSRFSSSAEVFPIPRPVYGQAQDPVAYLGRLLQDPQVEARVRENVDTRILATKLSEHIRFAPFHGHALVTVWADTPERAAALLDALVRQLTNASADDLYALARRDLPRARLIRRAHQLQAIIAKPPFGLVAGPRPGPQRPSHFVDRMVNVVPGRFPPRPGLLEVVLVVLALAVPFALLITREQRKPPVPGLDVRGFLRWLVKGS